MGGGAGAWRRQHCNVFCGDSIVTLFAAQHCSSLCSQSEGGEGCGDSTVAHFVCKVRGTKVAAIALPL